MQAAKSDVFSKVRVCEAQRSNESPSGAFKRQNGLAQQDGGASPRLWAFEGLQRLVKNGFQFTESNRAKRNRELVKRDNNNVFDFLESEGYIRLKADACTSSKELYEVYKMWCEENSLNAIKSRGFSDALITNQRRYNLESTNNIANSSGRRVRGFVSIETLVQPDLTPNGWRAGVRKSLTASLPGARVQRAQLFAPVI